MRKETLMRPNPLKTKLQRGEQSYGLFAFEFFTPGLAQAAQEAGAEYILFDMEHSGAGIDTIKQQMAYCRGLDVVPLVRVPTYQYQFVARALDVGALGIMVPMVETAEHARDIVSWTIPASRVARCWGRRTMTTPAAACRKSSSKRTSAAW
jgi:2-keto-3-deoxy-L-rhamnonate aldolase RhmA